jgi:hypothetical protein
VESRRGKAATLQVTVYRSAARGAGSGGVGQNTAGTKLVFRKRGVKFPHVLAFMMDAKALRLI